MSQLTPLKEIWKLILQILMRVLQKKEAILTKILAKINNWDR